MTETNKHAPWARAYVRQLGSGELLIEASPSAGIVVGLVPSRNRYLLLAFRIAADGQMSDLPLPGGSDTGMNVTTPPDFVGERFANILSLWREAAARDSSAVPNLSGLARVTNQPNWLALLALAIVLATMVFFGGDSNWQSLASMVLGVTAVALGIWGVLRAPLHGGRGYGVGGLAVLGGLASIGWAIFTLVS